MATDTTSLVWMRHQGLCFYCGEHVPQLTATVAHYTPRCKGGRHSDLNIVLACEPCNMGKRAMDPRDFGLIFPTPITAAQRRGLYLLRRQVVGESKRFRFKY